MGKSLKNKKRDNKAFAKNKILAIKND
jgi:hypothetical protein